jgi:hypothetical protein
MSTWGYRADEYTALSELEEDILDHMQRRFRVRGRIQGMFLMCEASKGIEDLFSGNRKLWVPFDVGGAPVVDAPCRLDPELNSASMVRGRFLHNVLDLYKRYPLLLYGLCLKLSSCRPLAVAC